MGTALSGSPPVPGLATVNSGPKHLILALLAVPALAVVLLAHGFLPGLLPDAATAYLAEGSIRCLNELGAGALTSWCHEFGEPLGYPLLTGGPVLVLGASLMYLPGVDSYGAYTMSGAVFDALALAGGYGLMRRLGAGPVVAMGTAVLYLITPTVIGLRGFGGTYAGFALLPAYAWCDLKAIEWIDERRGWLLAVGLTAYAAVRISALFLDGYSFLASGLLGAALWTAWIVRSPTPWARKAFGAAVFAGSAVVAVGIYQLYVPDAYEANPVGIFRSMGLDLVTLVAPTEGVWPAAKLNYAAQHQDLWGDGTNSGFNYMGLSCLLLALAYFLTRPVRREAVAVAAAGAIALVLALGPSLKVNEVKPTLSAQPTYADYLMPEGIATVDFPWAGLYTALPGVDSTRATYRWFGVTRLALVVLAGLLVARLVASPGRGRLFGVALACLVVVELAPNLPLNTRQYAANHDAVAQVRSDVEADLQRSTKPGERAFFLSYDGSHNDFMANFLAAGAGVRAYNAGGDKNAIMAQRRWGPEVLALASPQVPPASAALVLEQGLVDVIVAPFFHMRWSSYAWPPPDEMRVQAETSYAPLLADPALRVERFPWFATIRLSKQAAR